jgi:hypothetical protein
MQPRVVALISAVSLTIGWLLASVMTPPVARVQVLTDRAAIQPGNAEPLAPFTEQLQLRVRRAPQPPMPRRNPFAFAGRPRPSDVLPPPSPAPGAAPITPAAVGPTFSLSGIGVTETPSGFLHTAVLSDGNTVHLARAGDTVGGYRVVEVDDNSVTLADASGDRHVLRLKN